MAARFVRSGEDHAAPEGVARSNFEMWSSGRPARALLALADGGSARGVARLMDARQDTVRCWRDDFGRSGWKGRAR